MRKLVLVAGSLGLVAFAAIAAPEPSPSSHSDAKSSSLSLESTFADRWAPVADQCMVLVGHGTWCGTDAMSNQSRAASIRLGDALLRIAAAKARGEPVTEGRTGASDQRK